jgi:hypothetical protein
MQPSCSMASSKRLHQLVLAGLKRSTALTSHSSVKTYSALDLLKFVVPITASLDFPQPNAVKVLLLQALEITLKV